MEVALNSMRRLVLLNQMAGPLFRQLAEGLAPRYADGCLLVTGHPDTLRAAVDLASRGVTVYAAPAYDKRSRLRRALSWFRYALTATRHVLLARRGDAIVFVSNPPVLGPWIWLLTWLRPVPYAVLVYDIYPDILVQLGMLRSGGLSTWLWQALNRRVYSGSQAVVTIGHRMATTLERQIGTNGPRVDVVPPWADVHFIQPLHRDANPYADQFAPDGRMMVLYSGNMGASHDIESMLEAARLLRHNERICFVFIGEGDKHAEVVAYVARHGLSNVLVFPFQPEEMLPFTLSLADVSLVALDEGMEDLMVPSKICAYMAAGSAVIAITNVPSELADLLAYGDYGTVVPPSRPRALAEVIAGLAADPARLTKWRANARNIAERHFSRDVGVHAFATILENSGL